MVHRYIRHMAALIMCRGSHSAFRGSTSAGVAAASTRLDGPPAFAASRRRPARGGAVARLRTLAPLAAVLLVQGALSLSLRNTAFQDEALYLVSGRQLLNHLRGGSAAVEPFGLYFSGLPYFYPVVAGALDGLGGLELARLLSLCLMLGTTAAVFVVARDLFGRRSALLAATLFAVQGPVLFLGRLATYDATCLALLAVSTALAIRAGRAQAGWPSLGVGALLLMACAAKYAGLLFVPSVLAILAWQASRARGRLQAVLRVAYALMVVIGGIGIAALVLDRDTWQGLSSTTTDRVVLMPTPRTELALSALQIGALIGFLAAAGLAREGRRRGLLGIILLASMLLAPAYHVYKGELVALPKHLAYGMFFGSPLAGCALAGLLTSARATVSRRAAVACCLALTAAWGMCQARQLYAEWPDYTRARDVLRPLIAPDEEHFAEERHLPQYYLQDRTDPGHWSDLYWFDYTDAQGDHLHGGPAFRSALQEGRFDVVVLQDRFAADAAEDPRGVLGRSGRYRLVATLPWGPAFGGSNYYVWQRVTPRPEPHWHFSPDPANWRFDVQPGSGGGIVRDQGALRVRVDRADGTDWHVQCYQHGLTLEDGRPYGLSFRAKASAPRTVSVTGEADGGDYHGIGLRARVHLTGQWQTFHEAFRAHGVRDERLRAPAFELGAATGTVWLADVDLHAGAVQR